MKQIDLVEILLLSGVMKKNASKERLFLPSRLPTQRSQKRWNIRRPEPVTAAKGQAGLKCGVVGVQTLKSLIQTYQRQRIDREEAGLHRGSLDVQRGTGDICQYNLTGCWPV